MFKFKQWLYHKLRDFLDIDEHSQKYLINRAYKTDIEINELFEIADGMEKILDESENNINSFCNTIDNRTREMAIKIDLLNDRVNMLDNGSRVNYKLDNSKTIEQLIKELNKCQKDSTKNKGRL